MDKSLPLPARCVSQAIGATMDVPCHLIQFYKGWCGFKDVRLDHKILGIGITASPPPAPGWMQRRRFGKRVSGCAQEAKPADATPILPSSPTPAFFSCVALLPAIPTNETVRTPKINEMRLPKQPQHARSSQGVVAAPFWSFFPHLREDHN